MSQTVGEVITYFEGIADGLFKTFDKIEDKLQKFSKKEYSVNIQIGEKLTKEIEKAVGRTTEKLDEISSVLEKIAETGKESINSLKEQVETTSESIVMKVEEDASLIFKRIYSYVTTVIALVVSMSFKNVYRTLISISVELDLVLSRVITLKAFAIAIGKIGLSILKNFFNQIKETFQLTFKMGSAVENFFKTGGKYFALLLEKQNIISRSFSKTIAGFYEWIGLLGKGITQIGWIGIQHTMYNLFIRETITLVQRLTGIGLKAVTPIEHASQLMTTLDMTFHSVYLTGGQLFKSLTLGILAFTGPFSGIIAGIPFINSVVNTLLAFGVKGRSTFLAWLGSGKAQLEIIFLQLKDIAFSTLPLIESISKRLRDALFGGGFLGGIKRMMAEFFGFKKLHNTIDAIINRVKEGYQAISYFPKIAWSIGKNTELITKNIINLMKTAPDQAKSFMSDISTFLPNIEKQITKIGQNLTNLLDNTKNKILQTKQAYQAIGQTKSPLMLSGMIAGGPSPDLQTAALQRQADTQNKLTQSIKQQNEAQRQEQETLRNQRNLLKELLLLITDYEIMQKRAIEAGKKSSTLRPFSQDIAIILNNINQNLDAYATKELTASQATENISKLIPGLIKGFSEYSVSLQKLGLPEQANKLREYGTALQELNILPKTLGGEAAKGALDNFIKRIEEAAKTLQVKGETIGISFFQIIRESLSKSENRGQFEKIITSFNDFIMSFFPQSPAKRGPLTKLGTAGGKIVEILAEGMKQGTDKAGKAAGMVAERIAKYFPRSPVALGALTYLTLSGLKIPLMIAQGILGGISFVAKAAAVVGTTIMSVFASTISSLIKIVTAPFKLMFDSIMSVFSRGQGILEQTGFNAFTKWAGDISHLARQFNLATEEVSKFDFMLKTVEGSASDLTFAMRSIQETLNQVGDINKRIEFANFGIDLRAIASSAKPAEEMLLRISDAMKEYPRYKNQLLGLIGVFAGSATARLLEKPREEIERLGQEAIKSGAIINDKTAELSRKYNETVAKLSQVFESIKRELLVSVLPFITDKITKIYNLFLANRNKFSIIVSAFTTAVSGIVTIVIETFMEIMKEPGKAYNELQKVASDTLTLLTGLASDAFNTIIAIGGPLINILWLKLKTISIQRVSEIIEYITDSILSAVESLKKKIFLSVGRKVNEAIFGTDFSYDESMEKQRLRNEQKILELKGKILQIESEITKLENTPDPPGLLRGGLMASLGVIVAQEDVLKTKLKEYQQELAHTITLQEAFAAHSTKPVKDSSSIINAEIEIMQLTLNEALDSMKKKVDEYREKVTDPENAPLTNKIVNKFSELANKVKDIFAQLAVDVKESSQEMVENWADSIENMTKAGIMFEAPTYMRKPSTTTAKDKDPLNLIVPPAIDAIGNTIEDTINTFVEKGKIGMQELADISKNLFNEAFGDVVNSLKKTLTQALASLLGAQSELMSGIMSGILALGAFIMTRLQSTAEITHDALEETTVESTQAMRGVIAGIESIDIQTVSQQFSTGLEPLINETKGIRFLVAGIAENIAAIRGNLGGSGMNLLAGF